MSHGIDTGALTTVFTLRDWKLRTAVLNGAQCVTATLR
jgi:hypothetical protein